MAYLGNKPTAIPLTSADLVDGIVTSAKIADGTIASADLASGVGGITQADQWRLTTAFTATSTTDITSNLEKIDTSGQGTLGTGMTESSGIFTFPSTGIYLVSFTSGIEKNGDIRFVRSEIYVTINNSTYTKIAHNGMFLQQTLSNDAGGNSVTQSLIDVTDISNVKVKFAVAPDGTAIIRGNSTLNETHMTFIRLGDT